MRAGGVKLALWVGGAVTGVRGGATAVDVEIGPAVRPLSMRISLPFAETAAEFAFTKRRSSGS